MALVRAAMACKKAWSLSVRRRPRQYDRRQTTDSGPAAARGAPGAPWSQLLLFVVLYSFHHLVRMVQ